MKKRWVARPAPELDLKEAENTSGLPESISLLLARRGFSGEELNRFLNPEMSFLSHWSSVGGIREAACRIVEGIGNSEKILVHGDFDADGITATTILYRGLRSLGANIDYFIPDRFKDGYGLSEASIEACRALNTGLLVTVDCGITAVEQIEILSSLNVDTIVTDHHQPGDTLPAAAAVVDPVLDGNTPWSKNLPCGVAWMVLRAVCEMMNADSECLYKLLQLVAIGTVTDVVDLTGDNRILVSEGLKQLRNNPFSGVSALVESASLNISEINSTDIAFYVGPRLNACGRIGHASDAVELLLAESGGEASKLVSAVEEYNRLRRKLDREIEKHVIGLAKALDNPSSIVLAEEDWHKGVIGIVASRLVSRYGVPSILIAIENDTGFGSARSVPGIPVYSILSDIQDEHRILESLGGHPMAAGFRIPRENIPILRQEMNRILSAEEWKCHLGSVLYIDGKLEEQDYNAETVRNLESLEPFGEGNRKPVWMARGAYPVQWRAVGKKVNHLSCNFRIGSSIYKAIGFNMVNRQSLFNGKVDLAFTVSLDTYRGDGSIQLILKDIRRHRRNNG